MKVMHNESLSSLNFFPIKFSVLTDGVKPGAMRKQIWATEARLWLFEPKGEG